MTFLNKLDNNNLININITTKKIEGFEIIKKLGDGS